MLVRWKDAVSFGAQDISTETATTRRFMLRNTVGYLVREDAEGLIVAGDHSENEDAEWSHVMSIPAGMVIEKTILARVEPEPEIVTTFKKERARVNANDAHLIYDGQ